MQTTAQTLLEIGCAHGGFLDECVQLGWSVEGVELSRGAADVAMTRGHRVHCGDLTEAALEREQYDAVVSLATLEHVRSPKQFLSEAVRFVRPGGILMFTTIDMAGLIPRTLGRRWMQVAPPMHLYYFRQQQLVRYLHQAGLEPVLVGGKVVPGTGYYRISAYRPHRHVWNVGYVLFVAHKKEAQCE